VYEVDPVRRGVVRVGGQVVSGDRFADAGEPVLPFLGAVWLASGVQEEVPAGWAATVLRFDHAQGAAVERGLMFASPFGPELGQGGVVG
jgi:hypothetical protein